MSHLSQLSQDDHGFFGPGTDLVLSLAALMLLVIGFSFAAWGSQKKVYEQESQVREKQLAACRQDTKSLRQAVSERDRRLGKFQLDLDELRRNQMKVVETLAQTYRGEPEKIEENTFGIRSRPNLRPDILIENGIPSQRMRFGSHILFEEDSVKLKPASKVLLTRLAQALGEQLDSIREIQIQGHADEQKTRQFRSNLDLAAHRAIKVFRFLETRGLDPNRQLMSATTYGEYNPVARRQEKTFDSMKLKKHNESEEERRLNRRIEVIVEYYPPAVIESPDGS